MTYNDLVKKTVLTQPVYEPGKPIDLVAREIGFDPEEIIKLASNENPLGASPKAIEAIKKEASSVNQYPENSCYFLRQKLATRLELTEDQIIVGHGSNEIISLLTNAFVEPGVNTVMGKSAFISYKLFTLLAGGTPIEVPLKNFCHDLDAMLAAINSDTRIVYLPCPNNPTGTANSADEINQFIEKLPDHVVLCFDEAYAEYQDSPPDLRSWIAKGKKIICLRTFSKIYGLAGLRIGYGYCQSELTSILNRVRPPFNVNGVAQKAALAALSDDDWVKQSKSENDQGLIQLTDGLTELNLAIVPSKGNFLLVQFEKSDSICQQLLNKGFIVRPLKGYSLPDHLRITIGTKEQNRKLLVVLKEILQN